MVFLFSQSLFNNFHFFFNQLWIFKANCDIILCFLEFIFSFLIKACVLFPIVLDLWSRHAQFYGLTERRCYWNRSHWFLASIVKFLQHQHFKFCLFIDWLWFGDCFWRSDDWLWNLNWSHSCGLNHSWNTSLGWGWAGIQGFLEHFMDLTVVHFFRVNADNFDDFFVAVFVGDDFLFVGRIFGLLWFEELEKDLIGTAPFFFESFFLEERDFNVVNSEFSDCVSKIVVAVRIEMFISVDLLL